MTLTPLIETLVVFQELRYVPRLLDCQQNVPAPSKVNGAVMVDVTGLQAPTPAVGETVGDNVRVGVMAGGVNVRVGVLVMPGVNVRVGVLVGVLEIAGVLVMVGVRLGVSVMAGVLVCEAVEVRLGVFVITTAVRVGVAVREGEAPSVGVRLTVGVRVGVLVMPGVLVGPMPGSTPQTRSLLWYRAT